MEMFTGSSMTSSARRQSIRAKQIPPDPNGRLWMIPAYPVPMPDDTDSSWVYMGGSKIVSSHDYVDPAGSRRNTVRSSGASLRSMMGSADV
eukprot:1733490-Heterocapsa_arctica.AAC.1